jgi:hypothetical protein
MILQKWELVSENICCELHNYMGTVVGYRYYDLYRKEKRNGIYKYKKVRKV